MELQRATAPDTTIRSRGRAAEKPTKGQRRPTPTDDDPPAPARTPSSKGKKSLSTMDRKAARRERPASIEDRPSARWVRPALAAKALDVSVLTIYRWVKKGTIDSRKYGRTLRVRI